MIFLGGTLPLFSEKKNSDCQMPESPHLFWTMLWHGLTACDFTAASGDGGWLFSNWIGQINIGKIGMYHRPWGFLRGCIANRFFLGGSIYGEHYDRPQWMEGGCFANFQTNPQCLFWWSQLPLLSASLGWLDVRERMAIRDSGWPRYNWDSYPIYVDYGC